MNRLEKLEEQVKRLYTEKDPRRADWADWLFENHVLIVANYASTLAEKYDANAELARTAALLHDIADTCTKRSDKEHETISLTMARQIMAECGYNEDEIKLIVDDAIRFHSCHGYERPSSQEGKILATADALAHFKTDYYVYTTWAFGREMTLPEVKQWVLKKIERDFHIKIFFNPTREEVRSDYEHLKALFSR